MTEELTKTEARQGDRRRTNLTVAASSAFRLAFLAAGLAGRDLGVLTRARLATASNRSNSVLEGAPADREGEGGMRRRPAGVKCCPPFPSSTTVGNTGRNPLTGPAVTTLLATPLCRWNVEACENAAGTGSSVAKIFLRGSRNGAARRIWPRRQLELANSALTL